MTKSGVSLKSFKFHKVIGRGAYGKVMLVEKSDNRKKFYYFFFYFLNLKEKLYAMKIIKKEDLVEDN